MLRLWRRLLRRLLSWDTLRRGGLVRRGERCTTASNVLYQSQMLKNDKDQKKICFKIFFFLKESQTTILHTKVYFRL